MDIGEVARRAGVPASTLRYYEERGLIVSNGRHGLRRMFHASVLQRLALIALGRSAGFTLDEIARMFAADGRPEIDRGLLAAKATELDGTIRKLLALRDGLRHAARCPAPSHLECPTFRKLMAGALAGTGERPKPKQPPTRGRGSGSRTQATAGTPDARTRGD